MASEVYLGNTPLSNSYRHVYYLTSETDAYNTILPQMNHSYITESPIRNENAIRIPDNIDTIINTNYMMFKNYYHSLNPPNMWYFCFITSFEYINESMTKVYYEIDIMTTWFTKCTIPPCYVERNHIPASDDNLMKEYQPEPCDFSRVKQFVSNEAKYNPFENVIVILEYFDSDSDTSSVRDVSGAISACTRIIGAVDNTTGLVDDRIISTISTLVKDNKIDSISAFYLFPRDLYHHDAETPNIYTQYKSVTLDNTKLGCGYLPRNKKLLRFPYNFLEFCNSQGGKITIRPEDYGFSSTVSMCFECVPSPTASIVGYLNTNVLEPNVQLELDSQLNMSINYPVGFGIDSYSAWVASGGFRDTIIHGVASAATLGVGIADTVLGEKVSGVSMGISGAAGIASSISSIVSNSKKGDIIIGGQGGYTEIRAGKQVYYLSRTSITFEDAIVLDDFLSVYGYSINRVIAPHMNARQHWTYLKTRNCQVNGPIGLTDRMKIQRVFDSGVTLWRTVNNTQFGNYDVNGNT